MKVDSLVTHSMKAWANCAQITLYFVLSHHVCVCFHFSWSPRGVLLAAHNQAKYIKDGKVKQTPRLQCLAGHVLHVVSVHAGDGINKTTYTYNHVIL